MKRIQIILIILLLLVLVSCNFSIPEVFFVDYGNYESITLEDDYSFKLNNHQYNRFVLHNYEYIIYKDDLNDSQYQLQNEKYGNIYPYSLKNDTSNNIFYASREQWFYSVFDSYNWLWIKESKSLPFDTALINRLEFKINKDQDIVYIYEKKSFEYLFEKNDNVDFIWNENKDNTLYVDAYIGYVYISFFSEEYNKNFIILTKVYQDLSNNYYINLDVESNCEVKRSGWFQIKIDDKYD